MFRTTPAMLALAAVLGLTAGACGDDGPATPGSAPAPGASDATATLTAPADGARLAGGVDVTMAADGITIGPAGEVLPGTGHFHVIADQGCVAPGTAIAKDADHVHFGSGASTGTIYLEPGPHKLCLQVGDGAHSALAISDTAEIVVGVTDVDEWCDVIAEVDSLFATLETSAEPFAAQQAGFENARRLLAQLDDGVGTVDAEVRSDVEELLHWAGVMVATMLTAESAEAAAELLWGPESTLPTDEFGVAGEQWIRDTCGVSVG